MERNHFLVTLALYGRRARRLVARTTFAQLQTHPLCESRGRDQKRARELTLLLKRASHTLILLENEEREGRRTLSVCPLLRGRTGQRLGGDTHTSGPFRLTLPLSQLPRLLYYYYRDALIQAKVKRLVGERNPPPILTPC